MKEGDYVRVRKPEDVNDFPSWGSDMDKYDGKHMKIEHMDTANGIFLSETWWFSFDWVEAEPEQSLESLILEALGVKE